MKTNTILFLTQQGLPRGKRFLPAVVERISRSAVVARAVLDFEFTRGQELIGYFPHGNRFLRRTFEIVGRQRSGSGCRLKLVPTSWASVGEVRRSDRVLVEEYSYVATLGDEPDCPVLDIGSEGLALNATIRHVVGKIMPFTMVLGDDELEGTVTVMNVFARKGGGFRYGLACNQDKGSEDLYQTIRQLWVSLQIRFLETLPV